MASCRRIAKISRMARRWISILAPLLLLLPFMLVRAVRADGTLPPINTVFILLEENEDMKNITEKNAPYLMGTLLKQGAYATQYYNPPGLHPSLPNYIWLEAGDNLGVRENGHPDRMMRDTPDHLVSYLEQAGLSWRSYQEDISGNECPLEPVKRYVPRHNPMVYFSDVTEGNNPRSAKCIRNIRPYSELERDLRRGTVARYNFITPNLCNDMHDCGVTHGDRWLSREVPKILESEVFKNGGALFITWDEGRGASDGPIGMFVLSPYAKKGYTNTVRYDHSSTLRTMQEIFGVTPLLRNAASAQSLSDLFDTDFSSDKQPPTVAIRTPKRGDFVRGQVVVEVSASDNLGVTRVELFADNQLVSAARFPPYIVSWNASAVAEGEHRLTAKGYDAAGNVTVSEPVAISVQPVW